MFYLRVDICFVFIFKLPLIKQLLHVSIRHHLKFNLSLVFIVVVFCKLLKTATSSNEKSMFTEIKICLLLEQKTHS